MAAKKTKADTTGYSKWAREEYPRYAKKYGVDPNPDNPRHRYDFRAAFASGVRAPDSTGHWPSKFKLPGNPRSYLGPKGEESATPKKGYLDTKTGKKVK